MYAASCQPFILNQFIADETQTDSIIEISGNSEMFVVTSLNDPFSIFINQGHSFAIFEGWKLFHRDIALIYPHMKGTAVAITKDGKWAIAAGTVSNSDLAGVGVAAFVP